MTESTAALYGVEPVLIPGRVGIGTNLTCSWVDDLIPSVVLEWIVVLTTKVCTHLAASKGLTLFPTHTVAEDSLIAKSLISKLNKILLVNKAVTWQSTA